jgi:excisionase family DNA binding protein
MADIPEHRRFRPMHTGESVRLAHPIPEAADLIGVGRTKVYELIESGALGTVTIGRRRLVPHADLVDYIERLRSDREVA